MKGRLTLITLVTASLLAVHGVQAGSPGTTTGATVRGTVRFEGKVPTPKAINMAADPVCAKEHPSPAMAQEVVTNSNGDLQNVLVFVSDGLGDQRFDQPAQQATFEQKGCMYQPHVMAVRTNQPFEVVNEDSTSHNIHPTPANNREWNKAEPPGTKLQEAFAREEIAIPVKCNVHPWMRAYIAVFNHPFFGVTGKDGSFDLINLPAGTYTIKAWHEKLGSATQRVTVGANETKQISFVFKGM
jgi:hypothetical protein